MLKENSRFIFWILVALVVLMPALQIFPLDFIELQTASAQGSIVLNGTQSTSGTVSSSPYQITLSNFNVGTGSNRLLIVGVEANNNWVTSITFGGTQLTNAVSSFNNNDAEFWYLKNPNGTANIVVTMSGSTSVVVGAYSFFGVNQTNPIPTTATNHNIIIPNSPTISITTAYPDSWVIESSAIFGGATLSNPTCTSRWNVNVPNAITGASSSTIKASPGSVTCSWTASSGDFWDAVAIEVKAITSTTPSSPTNPTSTAISTTQIRLSWTAPSDNGGSAITGYKIQRASTSWVDLVNDTGNTLTNYNVTGLAANSFDKYRIAAWNGVGLGTYSANVTGFTLPGTPSNPAATTVSSSQINLIWTAPGGNATISGYKIERSIDSGSNWSTIVPNTGSSGTAYSDAGLSASTTYTYRVSAINQGGTGSPSDTASATTDSSQPPTSASTGILIPLYCGPYTSSSTCTNNNGTSFAWQDVNDTKNRHPAVPLFVIVNPNSGPCNPNVGCPDPDYQRGIANLTKAGIVVLGYVHTRNSDGTLISYTQVKNWIDNWSDWYKMHGLEGIFIDEMSNDDTSENVMYYTNLTNYIHGNFTYSIGNPGVETREAFIGTVDNMVIYEDFNHTSLDPLTELKNSTLQGYDINTSPFTLNYWHTKYDKNNFSFLEHGKTGSLSENTYRGFSPYVSLMYVTDDLFVTDPWDSISSYLDTLAGYLDYPSVLSTITAKDKSGNSLSIPIQINQSNNLVRNGTTPFTYNSTSGWQFNFFANQTSQSYTFCNWTYPGTNTTNNSILVAPTTNANYTATYTSDTC